MTANEVDLAAELAKVDPSQLGHYRALARSAYLLHREEA